MRRTRLSRPNDQAGFSLLEVLIAVIILSVALLGLAAAGGVAAQQVAAGRVDIARWTAIQQQLESLMAQGYGNISDSSAVVQGYPMTWTVTGTAPEALTLLVERDNFAGDARQDTVIMYLADPNP